MARTSHVKKAPSSQLLAIAYLEWVLRYAKSSLVISALILSLLCGILITSYVLIAFISERCLAEPGGPTGPIFLAYPEPLILESISDPSSGSVKKLEIFKEMYYITCLIYLIVPVVLCIAGVARLMRDIYNPVKIKVMIAQSKQEMLILDGRAEDEISLNSLHSENHRKKSLGAKTEASESSPVFPEVFISQIPVFLNSLNEPTDTFGHSGAESPRSRLPSNTVEAISFHKKVKSEPSVAYSSMSTCKHRLSHEFRPTSSHNSFAQVVDISRKDMTSDDLAGTNAVPNVSSSSNTNRIGSIKDLHAFYTGSVDETEFIEAKSVELTIPGSPNKKSNASKFQFAIRFFESLMFNYFTSDIFFLLPLSLVLLYSMVIHEVVFCKIDNYVLDSHETERLTGAANRICNSTSITTMRYIVLVFVGIVGLLILIRSLQFKPLAYQVNVCFSILRLVIYISQIYMTIYMLLYYDRVNKLEGFFFPSESTAITQAHVVGAQFNKFSPFNIPRHLQAAIVNTNALLAFESIKRQFPLAFSVYGITALIGSIIYIPFIIILLYAVLRNYRFFFLIAIFGDFLSFLMGLTQAVTLGYSINIFSLFCEITEYPIARSAESLYLSAVYCCSKPITTVMFRMSMIGVFACLFTVLSSCVCILHKVTHEPNKQ